MELTYHKMNFDFSDVNKTKAFVLNQFLTVYPQFWRVFLLHQWIQSKSFLIH